MATIDKYNYKIKGPSSKTRKPKPYTAYYATASSVANTADATGTYSAYSYALGFFQSGVTGNAALRLRDALSQEVRGAKRASLGITAIEWQSSLSMITQRAGQLGKAYSELRKGRVVSAMKTLTVTGKFRKVTKRARTRKPKKGQRYERARDSTETKFFAKWTPEKARQAPQQAWLEANFGWLPLYQDIYQVLDVLASSPAHQPVKVGLTVSRNIYHKEETIDYRPGSGPYGLEYSVFQDDASAVVKAKSGCVARATNPNAALLSGLGVTNPAHILWDAVPFSFVVDWLFPVGAYLKTFDAFLGFTVDNGWTTVKVTGNREFKHYYDGKSYSEQRSHNTSSCTMVKRAVSIPSVPYPFELVPKISPNLWQATTAVALLSTIFSKK